MEVLQSGLSVFVISALLGRFLAQRSGGCERDDDIVIESLWVYPVKSCRGIRVDSSLICPRGLKYDREFMVIDANNKFVSQRNFPKMALITTAIDEKSGNIILGRLDTHSCPSFSIPLDISTCLGLPRVKVTIWKDVCDAIDCGDEAAAWFSDNFGMQNCRLVRMAPEWIRETDKTYAKNGQNSFSDGFPFLLASVESLVDLNSRLPKPIEMINFRPNIVVRGVKQAWDEDNWGDFIISLKQSASNASNSCQLKMAAVKPCSRCQVPNINPNTGVEDPEKQPNKALKSIHCGKHMNLQSKKFLGEVMFGQNIDHCGSSGGIISVGDKITVTSSRPDWL